jgi:hypothetical protein
MVSDPTGLALAKRYADADTRFEEVARRKRQIDAEMETASNNLSEARKGLVDHVSQLEAKDSMAYFVYTHHVLVVTKGELVPRIAKVERE